MSVCCPSRVLSLLYQHRHCEEKLPQGRIGACSMMHGFKDILHVNGAPSPS